MYIIAKLIDVGIKGKDRFAFGTKSIHLDVNIHSFNVTQLGLNLSPVDSGNVIPIVNDLKETCSEDYMCLNKGNGRFKYKNQDVTLPAKFEYEFSSSTESVSSF